MSDGEQQNIFEHRRDDCPFADHIDHDSTHCDVHMFDNSGYEVIGDNSESLDDWMMEARGVQLDDVIARDTPIPSLPTFIPNIPRGNTNMYDNYAPEVVTVNLGMLVSPELLNVATSLQEALGVPPSTRVIIQCYGKDRLIENMWPDRHEVFRKLARLSPYAITSVNYSIWDSQPHAEHLLNIKRGLLTYEDLQELDLPTIPHVYWSGKRTLENWARWLQNNPCVTTVAINLQTLRKEADWQKAMSELAFFMTILPRDIHFLITGPQSLKRIHQVASILKRVSFSNGYASHVATAHHGLIRTGDQINAVYMEDTYSNLLRRNVEVYKSVLQGATLSVALSEEEPALSTVPGHLVRSLPVS